MRSRSLGIVGGIGLTLAFPVWSADAPEPKGWFVEARVVESESAGGEAPFTFADERTGVVLGGGYSFTRHLALEGAVYELGKHAATDCSAPVCTAVPHDRAANVRAVSVAAIGTWRVAPLVEIFGKFGVLGSRADYTHTAGHDTDGGALLGAGIGILATPRWRINVQYERADHELDLESAGVGVTYRF